MDDSLDSSFQTGCHGDDLVTLHLTINHSDRTVETISACDSFLWSANSTTYYNSSTDSVKKTNIYQCDSLCLLHLTVNHSASIDTSITDCSGSQWNGTTYFSDTTLVFNLRTVKGCDSIVTLHLHLLPIPEADLRVSPSILTYNHPTLTAVSTSRNATAIQWFVDSNPYDTTATIAYTALPTQDTVLLTLIATNGFCNDTATRSIPVLPETVFIPNIISPNADDISNRTFRPVGKGIINYQLTIYNRQGTIVFHTTDINQGWDGTHNGQPCQQGTYIYRIQYTTPSSHGVQSRTGSITLVR